MSIVILSLCVSSSLSLAKVPCSMHSSPNFAAESIHHPTSSIQHSTSYIQYPSDLCTYYSTYKYMEFYLLETPRDFDCTSTITSKSKSKPNSDLTKPFTSFVNGNFGRPLLPIFSFEFSWFGLVWFSFPIYTLCPCVYSIQYTCCLRL